MASNNSYTATIIPWAGVFTPDNWLLCEGQLLPISEYQDLFKLIGKTYGGDGKITFGVPDIRGRTPIGSGELQYGKKKTGHKYLLGQTGGEEKITLSFSQLPEHTHTASLTITEKAALSGELSIPVNTDSTSGGNNPVNKYFGNSGNAKLYYSGYTKAYQMASVPLDFSEISEGSVTLEHTGAGESFYIYQPYIALKYIICAKGIYPPHF